MTPPIRKLPDKAFVAALDGKMLYYACENETPEHTAERFEHWFHKPASEVIVVGQWCYVPLRGAAPRW